MARAAVRGAGLNVRINVKDLVLEGERSEFLARCSELEDRAADLESRALVAVAAHLA
jgi:formiminotetrahydrofolate cyclodeaminase